MSDQGVRTRVASAGQVSAMLWNSSVAYLVANMVVIVLHESAHTVAGLVQGYDATQFTGEVRFTPDQTSGALVITALAGQLFSLVSELPRHEVPSLPRTWVRPAALDLDRLPQRRGGLRLPHHRAPRLCR